MAAEKFTGSNVPWEPENLENNNCRFYENKYPEVEDFVLVQVKSVEEMGAYVELLEYNHIDGMILSSEFSRRRIRSVNKLIRVGRQEVVVVLRVDKEKGYIDLSKRRVTPEDIAKCEEKYNKSKAVHSILRQVSEICKVRLEKLYTHFAWDLYKRFGHASDAFQAAIEDPQKVLGEYNLPNNIIDLLLKTIQRRMAPQAVKVRSDIEISCFNYEGIDAVKEALRTGEAVSTEHVKVKVKLLAPPLYVMMAVSMDKEIGLKLLNEAINVMNKSISAKGGSLTIKKQPYVVTTQDDKDLATRIEELEELSRQVDGDNPEED